MNLKLIGLIIGAVLFLSYSAGLFYLGEQHCKSSVNTAVIKAEQKQDKAVEKVQLQAAQREAISRANSQSVEKANDETCLDASPGVTVIRVFNQIRSSP